MMPLDRPVRPTRFRPLLSLVVALFAGLLLAGCGGEGTSTTCNLDSCTVTFDRGVDARAEVLGVEAKLVGVKDDEVTLDIAGNEVTAQVGQSIDVEGFKVEVQEVTDSEVKVKISGSSEGG